MPEVNSSFTEKTDEFSKKTVTEMILTLLTIRNDAEHAVISQILCKRLTGVEQG